MIAEIVSTPQYSFVFTQAEAEGLKMLLGDCSGLSGYPGVEELQTVLDELLAIGRKA